MTDLSTVKQVLQKSEPMRSATPVESGSSRGQHVHHTAMRHPAQRSAGASSRSISVRGKSQPPKGEIPMKKKTENKVDSLGASPAESQILDSLKIPSMSQFEKWPYRFWSLAVVSSEFSDNYITCVENMAMGPIIEFEDLYDMENMPVPIKLREWLVADKVLVDCGKWLGLIPHLKFVEAGLFHCNMSNSYDVKGNRANYLSVTITLKGVAWLKKHYVPTPERHRCDYVPPEFRGPID